MRHSISALLNASLREMDTSAEVHRYTRSREVAD